MANSSIVRYLRIVFGLLYVFAGLAKAFPQVENISQTLRSAALNNAGTVLEPASQWFESHSGLMTVVVGLALSISGLCYLLNRWTALVAAGQLLMMACFIAVLFTTAPAIMLIDLPFIAVAILLIRDALGSSSSAGAAVDAKV